MALLIPSSYKTGKKNSPKWFNSQCAKAVNNKNRYFKVEATSKPAFKNFIHQFTQHLLRNDQKCQIEFCPMHPQQNRFLPGLFSLLLVYGQLSAKTFANHLSLHNKTALTLLLPVLHKRPIILHQPLPPTTTWTTKGPNHITPKFKIQTSLCHKFSFPHEESANHGSSLSPLSPRALMIFQ